MALIQKVIFSFLGGLVCYLLLQIIFGSTGLMAHQDLRRYHQDLVRRNEELRLHQDYLYETIDSLQNDPTRLLIEARNLGYYRPNEVVVRFTDIPKRYVALTAEGDSPPIRYRPLHERSALFRGIALICGLLLLVICLWRTPNRNSNRTERY